MSRTARIRFDRRLRIAGAGAALAVTGLFCWFTPSASATFPGVNGKIAFVGNPEGLLSHRILVMNPDGSGVTQLTSGFESLNPSFSPDGKRIAYSRPEPAGFEGIWVMNADGSGQTRLTNDPSDDNPSFSPDGRIVFDRQVGSDDQIIVMNADGSGQTNLSNSSASDQDPAFSPLGNQVIFERFAVWGSPFDPITQIVSQSTSGPSAFNISKNLASTDGSPSFSPNGQKVLFNRSPADFASPDPPQVFSMNAADGSGQTNLLPGVPSGNAVYSPDGQRIALNAGGLSVMNADGSGRTVINSGSAPDWQALAGIRFGKLKRNKNNGTATLTVEVPAPGTLALSGKGVVKKRPAGAILSKVVNAAGKVKLKIKSKGKKKRKLSRAGKVKLKIRVAYTPTGSTAAVKTKKLKLKKTR